MTDQTLKLIGGLSIRADDKAWRDCLQSAVDEVMDRRKREVSS
jgi:hypothetical protein